MPFAPRRASPRRASPPCTWVLFLPVVAARLFRSPTASTRLSIRDATLARVPDPIDSRLLAPVSPMVSPKFRQQATEHRIRGWRTVNGSSSLSCTETWD